MIPKGLQESIKAQKKYELRRRSLLFAQNFMQNDLGIQVGDCVRSIDLERMRDQLAESLFKYGCEEEFND
ncbi:hypothetical protein, partial [Streptococcus pneumoniae]|uniref:hypothetical protein n=1 Tax=Streptococcus pneumoniae TaxID=1313 RepID=UPI001E61453D